ncbi:hypothetical protein ES705_33776 [subsurface metagenome]
MNNTNGTGFFKRFTKIRGDHPISSIRRLTWKGKIRLGIQVPTLEKGKDGKYKKDQNGDLVQRRDKFGELEFHPKDVSYFVCPKEVKARFGDEPIELDIAFPLSGLDENGLPDVGGLFPQAYKYYGSSRGLKCVGDGETAMKANEKGVFEEVECPCDKFGQKDGCSKRASLFFFIPDISMGGIYVIDSGSYNTMVDVQSGIYLALELLKDPITSEYNSITMLPFKLRRMQKETQHEGRKDKHWPLTCELDLLIEDIKKIRTGKTLFLGQRKVYQIPEREEDINPKLDSKKNGAVIEEPEIEEGVKKEEEKETEDQEKKKETKEKPKGQNLKKEIEESRAREAQLKKDQEEGKGKLKAYQESKETYKEKVKEETKILLAISKQAQKAGIDNFDKLVKFAVDMGIFKTMLSEHLARKVLTSNKDIYNQLMKALEPPTEADKEKLDKIFERFKEAGLDTWKEIAWFACKAFKRLLSNGFLKSSG